LENRFYPTREDFAAASMYALAEARRYPVADIIDNADFKMDLSRVAKETLAELAKGYYTPAPLGYVSLPEPEGGARMAALVRFPDLVALYGIFIKIGPVLESLVQPAVLSHRWRPGDFSVPDNSAGASAALNGKGGSEAAGDNGGRNGASRYGCATNLSGWSLGRREYLRFAKAAAPHYDRCVKTDLSARLKGVTVRTVRDKILNGGLATEAGMSFLEAAQAFLLIYEFWALHEEFSANGVRGLPPGSPLSSFLANVAVAEIDAALANGMTESPKPYVRYGHEGLLFARGEEGTEEAARACEEVMRKFGDGEENWAASVVPASSLLEEEAAAAQAREALTDPEEAAAWVRKFVSPDYYDGDPNEWADKYAWALEVLEREGEDSAFDAVLHVFTSNPPWPVLGAAFRYLRRFSPRFYFTGALVVALSRENGRLPIHNYYLYRLGAYGREYSPALRELALYDAADVNKDWCWRLGALQCLNTFDLAATELNRLEAMAISENDADVVRAAQVVLQQRPGREGSAGRRSAPTIGWTQPYLTAYLARVAAEEAPARALLREIEAVPCWAPETIDRLHQYDLLKGNANVKEEFGAVLDRKISECDLTWGRLLRRLEGIRNRRTA